MKNASRKTSTWLGLQNPVLSKPWLAMAISGSGIGAGNAAAAWALNALDASTVLISRMARASGLPGTLLATPPA